MTQHREYLSLLVMDNMDFPKQVEALEQRLDRLVSQAEEAKDTYRIQATTHLRDGFHAAMSKILLASGAKASVLEQPEGGPNIAEDEMEKLAKLLTIMRTDTNQRALLTLLHTRGLGTEIPIEDAEAQYKPGRGWSPVATGVTAASTYLRQNTRLDIQRTYHIQSGRRHIKSITLVLRQDMPHEPETEEKL